MVCGSRRHIQAEQLLTLPTSSWVTTVPSEVPGVGRGGGGGGNGSGGNGARLQQAYQLEDPIYPLTKATCFNVQAYSVRIICNFAQPCVPLLVRVFASKQKCKFVKLTFASSCWGLKAESAWEQATTCSSR